MSARRCKRSLGVFLGLCGIYVISSCSRDLEPTGAIQPSVDEATWTVAQGDYEGKPMVARMDEAARTRADVSTLSTRLGIAVPLLEPDEHGLPRGPEALALEAIEERIVGALAASGGGRLVLVITTAGMREFVSYVQSAGVGEAVASQVRSATTLHEVQHYTESDPEWSVLTEFVSRWGEQ